MRIRSLILITAFLYSINQFAAVKAQFTYTVNADTSVTIVNTSTGNASAFKISWGDDTFDSLSEKVSLTHKYQSFGTYDICLIAFSKKSAKTDEAELKAVQPLSDTLCQTIEVVAIERCKADFNFTINGLSVELENASLGNLTKVKWDFGDGGSSAIKTNFAHNYKNPGVYTISLTVEDKKTECTSTISKTITIKRNEADCISKFTYTTITDYKYQFTFTGSGDVAKYLWSFGDGKTSDLINPEHEYKKPGTYLVKLTVKNTDKSSISVFKQEISVMEDAIEIQPDFDFEKNTTDDTVLFKNKSKGYLIKEFKWNFGDGSSSSDTNPVHKYSAAGDYLVTLAAINKNNNKSYVICKTVTAGMPYSKTPEITIGPSTDKTVDFISFLNETPDSLKWDFGDGTISKDSLPTHQYPDTGIYLVSLKTKYSDGSIYEKLHIVNLTSDPYRLVGRFKAGVEKSYLKSTPRKVRFKGTLSGDISRLRFNWDFGDNTTDSVNLEVDHTYADDGAYYACFNVSNDLTGEVDTYCDSIILGEVNNIETINVSQIATIYPNPADNFFNLTLKSISKGNIRIELTDIAGRTVKVLYNGKSKPELSFNRTGLKAGLYIINIKGKGLVYSGKLILK